MNIAFYWNGLFYLRQKPLYLTDSLEFLNITNFF